MRCVFSFDRRRGGVFGTEPTRGGTGAAPDAVGPETEATVVALRSAVDEGDEGVVVVVAA